jgi:DNA-binding transcriptional LysR family regulator
VTLDWNDLRYLLAVARTGSLAKAARALGVHQTTVGRRIRAAEEAVGDTLFLRSATGLAPAPLARSVLASLEDLAGELERIERRAHSSTGGNAGLVRLAVTETTARLLVARTLPELVRDHPEIRVELVPANVATDLGSGEADIGVRLVDLTSPDLVRKRLGAVRYGLYATRDYLERRGEQALSADLEGHDTLVPSRELARGPEAQWLASHASEARPILFSSSLETLARACASGLGIAALPTNLAALHPELRLLRRLEEIPPRPVYLVVHRDVRRIPRVRTVAERVSATLSRVLSDAD